MKISALKAVTTLKVGSPKIAVMLWLYRAVKWKNKVKSKMK
jgi:hypothetical protein